MKLEGRKMYCPACKTGTYHTVKVQQPYTFFTCRGICGFTLKVKHYG